MDLHHPITKELPEQYDTIKRLKACHAQFRQWFSDYHQVDDWICRIEEEIEFAGHQELEELKRQRAWLKDRIYQAIRQASPLRLEAQPQLGPHFVMTS